MYPLICLAKQCFSTAHSAQTPGRHFTIPGTALSFALFSQLRTRFLLKLEKVSSIMLPLTTPNIWGLQYGASSRSSGRRSTSDRNAPGRGPRARPSEVWPFSPQRFRSQLPRTPRGRALGGRGALGGWGGCAWGPRRGCRHLRASPFAALRRFCASRGLLARGVGTSSLASAAALFGHG